MRITRKTAGRNAGLLALLLASSGLLAACTTSGRQEIGVYSGRHYNTDKALYEQFTAETGIKVKLLEAKDDALIERLRNEGSNSPADVLILADAARLDRAADLDLFQTVDSAALEAAVPSDLRDPNNRWFGLTRRLRAPIINPAQVTPTEVNSYRKLADPALQGRLCLRNRRSVYNQSLVAFMIDRVGEEATADWIKGMVANLAQPMFSSDTPMIRAVAQGKCGVALANTYYLGRLQAGKKGEEDRALSSKVAVVWPDPVHVNITGGGVTSSSSRPKAAQQFLEFLVSNKSQGGYAAANHEYPLRGFGNDPIVSAWGPFQQADVSAARLGELNGKALDLMTANGWQ
ncbi:iron deficiency-induced protein A [Synechococcus sp. RS9909]|uniref:extracellular solute-binding protein n=1 Tax=unclassified Synechococcus TaxID=2626047 RepID=UPI000068F6BE|nr:MULTISPECIES: extracellular solute-binding protein [unclassified Synechococcus]EAQ69623.1 putative iron ABC transporter, substrate binding protein [Synechococcus sp. RS9917]QNI80107.1 iron deficiency-induced protein A [Synechococcus sp. RS9909]